MPAYLVTYDLRKVRNYDALLKALRDSGCISPLESVWLGNMTGPATGIRDAFAKHMDADDGLLVIELKPGSQWGSRKLNNNAADWLRANVTS